MRFRAWNDCGIGQDDSCSVADLLENEQVRLCRDPPLGPRGGQQRAQQVSLRYTYLHLPEGRMRRNEGGGEGE